MIHATQFRCQRAASFRGERGQTIALVAICLVSFVAMGALAIDLTSLYSARGEIQRAADATALAGAKAFVDSGVTTDPYPTNNALQTLATTMANAYATAAASQNLVSNAPAQIVGTPTIDLTTHLGNPTITVKLQRTNLPLFFSRIWSGNFGTVTATAMAEAYNPAFSKTNLPSAPKCVKPILLPNQAPNQVPGNPSFVNINTGQVTSPGNQFLGIPLDIDPLSCNPSSPGCPGPGNYLPMQVSGPHQYPPACSPVTGTDFERSIESCDGTPFNAPQCGTGTAAAWDQSINPASNPSPVTAGLQCLTHATSGNTADSLDLSAFNSGNGPILISPGSFSQSRYGLASTDRVLTSDSVITVPIFDQTSFSPSKVTIVGFLTLFVNQTHGKGGFSATILNVTGCGPNPSTAPPVSGGGVSSIPVRLIHN